MKKIKQRLLGGSKLLTKDEKRLLFDLLIDNSKVNNDRLEADKKLSMYFSELYIKYLVPKDILSLEKKCHPEFINKIGGIYIEGSKLFNIDFIYVKEGYTKDDYSITTDQYIQFSKPLVDVRCIYEKDNDKIREFDVGKALMSKLNEKEKYLLKSLFCDLIECNWNKLTYLQEYRGNWEYFPNLTTWDSLYKLNPDWYDLLYNHLTYNNKDRYNQFSETLYDIEINEAENIDKLIKKVIKYINE